MAPTPMQIIAYQDHCNNLRYETASKNISFSFNLQIAELAGGMQRTHYGMVIVTIPQISP